MASINTNTGITYTNKSLREDYANFISNIDPTDVPFLSNIGTDTAAQPLTEWQTDSFATAVSTNQHLEGEIFVNNAQTQTNRVNNYCEIAMKVAEVSRTDEVSKAAGFTSLMAYQIAKMSKELKRDMETALTSDNVANGGSSSVARVTAALGSWVVTNWYDAGTGGSPAAPIFSGGGVVGHPSTAAVNSTNAAIFTETMLKTEIQTVWSKGGDINKSFLMLGPHNKTVFSGFSGIATRFRDVPAGKQAQIIGASDTYVSDFGTINVVPNRFQPENRAYIIDPSMVSVAYLRRYEVTPVASLADSKKNAITAEYALRVKNEKSLGIIRNLAIT